MADMIRGISSMATRQVLADLATAYEQRCGQRVEIESVGGVDAAKRVQAGEPFDVVFLASDAIDKLVASGAAVAGSKVDLVRSGVGVAVRSGASRPDIATEDALRRAVLAAPTIGYSTGPSGTALLQMFERWGIGADIRARLVQAPAGVPVGALVARADVALGFQQMSELIHIAGIDLVGTLPEPVRIITTFSGALCSVSSQGPAVRGLLDFMASPEAEAAKRRQGMEPA